MMRAAAVAAISACLAGSAAADQFRQTLISNTANINVTSADIQSRDVTPGSPAWSIRKLTLHGGKQEGVDLVIIDNGKMKITLIPTRGMGIYSVEMGDMRLGWDSPVKEIVHPQFINLTSRDGLGWLEGFNEFMVRCGMEFSGHPGKDEFINNVGDKATMDLTLHGRVGNLPAQEVVVVVEKQAPYTIAVIGHVDERMFYGPKLELRAMLSTEPGSNSFRISDAITNRGAAEQEVQMLYHVNFGRPLLEEGAAFVGAVERVTPFNDNAARGISTYAQYAGPKLGFIEQVYCIRPLADERGHTTVMLRNQKQDRGVSMEYAIDTLPYLTLWKNTAAEREGYVTGVEPGTGYPSNRRIERKAGRVPKLAADASRSMNITFTLHDRAEQVRQVAERIANIQAQRQPVIDQQPVKVE